jgi:hypothetical protein
MFLPSLSELHDTIKSIEDKISPKNITFPKRTGIDIFIKLFSKGRTDHLLIA